MPYATNDGGFIYETGHYKEDRSHSYGSMTYAGLKSLLFARVDKEDIRVKKEGFNHRLCGDRNKIRIKRHIYS